MASVEAGLAGWKTPATGSMQSSACARVSADWRTHQLAQTELSLAEIALAAGFSDQSHFSNLFRHHTGFSPSKFRRVARSA
jgi:transcriptional regulator GlxA family with amidase domain